MDYHLERGIRFTTEIEHPGLYGRALQEVDENGKVIGSDQIPWHWTLSFSGSAIRHSHNVKAQGDGSESQARETIQIDLTPYERSGYLPSYSMFGTARKIDIITLTVRRSDKDIPSHRCELWGIVSYTSNDDFRQETQPDMLGFELELADKHFDELRKAAISNRDYSILFSVSDVAGFYSHWSPDIFTDQIKVFTGYDEQHVVVPPEVSPVARLGEVGVYDLTVARRSMLSDWDSQLQGDNFRNISELSQAKRGELIETVILKQFSKDDEQTYKGTPRYRTLKAIAVAAFDHAATHAISIDDYQFDVASKGFELEDDLYYAVTENRRPNSPKPPDRNDYWQHHEIGAEVKQGRERIIYRDYVEGVSAQYLALPYRVPAFERLLVDVLIATEMYAYFSEATGSKAKPDKFFGFTHHLSLLKPHPLWAYVKGIFFDAVIICAMGGAIGFGLSYWSAAAVVWTIVATACLVALSFLNLTIRLPFAWRRYSKFMEYGSNLIRSMNRTYSELHGSSIVSTRRLRDVASQAADAGVGWPTALFAILDDNIQRTGQLAPPQFLSR